MRDIHDNRIHDATIFAVQLVITAIGLVLACGVLALLFPLAVWCADWLSRFQMAVLP